LSCSTMQTPLTDLVVEVALTFIDRSSERTQKSF
jgi:hypothetical protein